MLFDNAKHTLNGADAHLVLRQVSLALNKMECASGKHVLLHGDYVNATITRFGSKFYIKAVVP
jgi:hydrogenase maturation factor